ncbi:MAG: molybdopterin-dependent oxidoreductase [Anaerolineae bacterium]
MKPRLVDWSILALVGFQVLTGLTTFLMGNPREAWLFVVHGAGGIALLGLLYWKFRRVVRRVANPLRWSPGAALSVLIGLLSLATVGTGILWAFGLLSERSFPTGVSLHAYLALLLFPLVAIHVLLRQRSLRREDFRGRRDALRWLGLAGVGALALGGQAVANRVLDSPGARRRFTGSRELGTDGGNGAFPPTIWALDHPARIDPDGWQLRVAGAVQNPLSLPYSEVRAHEEQLRATLDCTSGWYSTQDWEGIRVDQLLARCRPSAEAGWVRFRSVTGYRWSLPIDEARDALLATRVAGEPLAHYHGFPLRLVAPGRRGFQWVKWVEGLDLLTAPDLGQWVVIFTSGLSEPQP